MITRSSMLACELRRSNFVNVVGSSFGRAFEALCFEPRGKLVRPNIDAFQPLSLRDNRCASGFGKFEPIVVAFFHVASVLRQGVDRWIILPAVSGDHYNVRFGFLRHPRHLTVSIGGVAAPMVCGTAGSRKGPAAPARHLPQLNTGFQPAGVGALRGRFLLDLSASLHAGEAPLSGAPRVRHSRAASARQSLQHARLHQPVRIARQSRGPVHLASISSPARAVGGASVMTTDHHGGLTECGQIVPRNGQ